jgi:hypothetical protein
MPNLVERDGALARYGSRRALHILFVAILLLGFVAGRYANAEGQEPILSQFFATLVLSFCIFFWYREDSDEQQFQRSLWWNVGILILALVAVPLYLVRSRPHGRRLAALLKMCAALLGLFVAATAGGITAALFFTPS